MIGFLDHHGIPSDEVVAVSIRGDPHSEILRYAERHAVGMVVMGTHGRRELALLLMGSVAEQVVRGSTCPVLTVPEERWRPSGLEADRRGQLLGGAH